MQLLMDDNQKIFEEEMARSGEILKQNRHSTFTGEWFGPSEEPNPPGIDCKCSGCRAVRWLESKGKDVGL